MLKEECSRIQIIYYGVGPISNFKLAWQKKKTQPRLNFVCEVKATMSEQYIKYEAELHVMKCRICKDCITKNGIAYHYRQYHKEVMSLQARKALVQYCNDFNLYTKKEFKYPETIISPIEDRVVEKGVRCLFNDCNYACILSSSMKEHCKETHDWVISKGITFKDIFLTVSRGYVD
jgi:hypothetical protein